MSQWPNVLIDVDLTGTSMFSSPHPTPVTGVIRGWRQGFDEPVHKVIFHIPNFRNYRGELIQRGLSSWIGRAKLENGDWQIVIDQPDPKHQFKELKATGGFAITHVGCLERKSGELFSPAQAEELFNGLLWFLSFCNGRWTGPALFLFYDSESEILGHEWSIPRVTPFQNVRSWFSDLRRGILPHTYSGFAEKWSDPLWSDTIRIAIYWYLTANAPGVAIENGVVLSSLVYETIGWTLLVEDTKALSRNGFDKLPAFDKLRLLLTHCGIPLSIPTELTSLQSAARSENWSDGPEAIAAIRNGYVHMSPKNRERITRTGKDSDYDAWMLSLYYLEMILLYLFKYNGEVSSRLINTGWLGNEVQQVPWS